MNGGRLLPERPLRQHGRRARFGKDKIGQVRRLVVIQAVEQLVMGLDESGLPGLVGPGPAGLAGACIQSPGDPEASGSPNGRRPRPTSPQWTPHRAPRADRRRRPW